MTSGLSLFSEARKKMNAEGKCPSTSSVTSQASDIRHQELKSRALSLEAGQQSNCVGDNADREAPICFHLQSIVLFDLMYVLFYLDVQLSSWMPWQ